MGPPQLCFPLGLGDVMQIKQFICDFSVCKQIVMACLSNRRCCKLDFSVGKLMTSAKTHRVLRFPNKLVSGGLLKYTEA